MRLLSRLKFAAKICGIFSAAWVAIAVGSAYWHGLLGFDAVRFADLLPTVVFGAATGLLAGLLFAGLLALLPSRTVGAFLGHLALLPPAVRGGYWAAGYLAQQGGMQELGLTMSVEIAYGVGFAIAAASLVTAGSVVGILVQSVLALPFLPLRGTALGARLARAIESIFSIKTALFACLLAIALGYAEFTGRIPWPEPESPAVSRWIDAEKEIFAKALARGRYDMLVLPVAVSGPSFDRAERSLMTRHLAQRIAQRTGRPLPDPTLVARALGTRTRDISQAEAMNLARSMQASHIVAADVRRGADTFRMRVRFLEYDANAKRWAETRNAALDDLRYDDHTPPALAVRAALDRLLDDLKIATSVPAAVTPGSSVGAPALHAVPEDLLAFAKEAVTAPLEHAIRLQLFASLHQRESIEAQLLWERSLLALAQVDETQSLRRTLEARAYLHLQRRPYALARLGENDSAEGRALLAVLNGDVPGAESAIEGIVRPELLLAAAFELADLYTVYGLHARRDAMRDALLAKSLAEAMPLARRVSPDTGPRAGVHEKIYGAIESRLPGMVDARLDTALVWLRWLYWQPELDSGDGLWLARLIERNRGKLWFARGADWIAQPASDRLAEWDYYDLMISLNRTTALATLRSTLYGGHDVERADAILATLSPVLDGYPEYTVLQSAVMGKVLVAGAPKRAERVAASSRALALSGCIWEGGESRIALEAEHLSGQRGCGRTYDEPLRSYRSLPLRPPRNTGDAAVQQDVQKELQEDIALARRRLAYADRDASALALLVAHLRKAGNDALAQEVLAQSSGRFVGAPERGRLYEIPQANN